MGRWPVEPVCRGSFFFFSSRRRHTRLQGDWSSDVCSSDLPVELREVVTIKSLVALPPPPPNPPAPPVAAPPKAAPPAPPAPPIAVTTAQIGRASCRERV